MLGKLVIPLMLAGPFLGFGLVVFILFYPLYRKYKNIETLATTSIKGRVVAYSLQKNRPPIVEYQVDGQKYENELEYVRIRYIESPYYPMRTELKSNLLDLVLVIQKNSAVSRSTVLPNYFPIGTEMTVWYNPKNPKQAFVERPCGFARIYKSPCQFAYKFMLVGLFLWLLLAILIPKEIASAILR